MPMPSVLQQITHGKVGRAPCFTGPFRQLPGVLIRPCRPGPGLYLLPMGHQLVKPGRQGSKACYFTVSGMSDRLVSPLVFPD